MGDARYVDTTGGDVGGDDDVQAAILQRLDHALALVLGDVAVQRSGLVALGLQGAGQVQGGLLGAHEGDQCVELLDFQQAQYGTGLLVGMDHQVGLFDARDGLGLGSDPDVLRIAQVTLGDRTDRRRQGGGEQHALAAFREGFEDHFEVVHEAELEHLVRLVQHQLLHGGEHLVVTTQVVAETAGGGHDDLGALAQGLELRAHGRAAVDGDHVQAGHLLGVGFEGGGDLQCEFAGRCQDQRLRLSFGRIDARQDRQREGCGLASTGLGLANHVVAGEDHRNRLGLDGGRLFIADCRDGGQNVGMNAERGESADFLGHGSASMCIRKDPCSMAAHAVKDLVGHPAAW
ncbi:hypothetical protein D9M68_638790 [compost metagenome]